MSGFEVYQSNRSDAGELLAEHDDDDDAQRAVELGAAAPVRPAPVLLGLEKVGMRGLNGRQRCSERSTCKDPGFKFD